MAAPPAPAMLCKPVERCRLDVRQRHGLPAEQAVGIGGDRLDYTKGIEERLRDVERLLEMEPHWGGRFTFIHITAPTPDRIAQNQDNEARERGMATRIYEHVN